MSVGFVLRKGTAMQWVKNVFCLMLALIICRSADCETADWSQWHGPRRDNICNEKGLLKSWPEAGPKLLWTAKGCGMGYSTVSISGGMIFTSGIINKQTVVFALDMKGKHVWKALNGGAWEADARQKWAIGYAGARGTPTVDGGLAYQLSDLGRLGVFDAKTGREVWSVEFTKRFGARPPNWGYAESVLIDGDNVICYPGGPRGYMAALHKKTGALVWANTDIGEPASYCSAILATINQSRQLITVTRKSVIGVDAESGKLLWRYPFTNMRGINVANPIYKDGFVFASSGYGNGSVLLKINKNKSGFTAEKVWFSESPDNHHGGVVLVDGYLYGSGSKKRGWTCLDFKTGWENYRAESSGKGSVLYADGMLYCFDEGGGMQLVEASLERWKVVSEFDVPQGGKGKFWAHPVIHNGRLYLRHAAHIYVYDVKK